MRSIAWLLLFFALLAPRTTSAAPRPKWTSADVPLQARDEGGTALVPLSAPSKEHPLGTVAIFGQNVADRSALGGEGNLVLRAYAWDVAAQKVIATRAIGRLPCERSVVSAVRDGDRILLVAAGHYLQYVPQAEVTLFTIDEALEVVSHEVIGIGETPSLAISDRWIVAGFFENRTTDVHPVGDRHMEMHLAFHALVLDRTTHAVVDARVFQGARLLAPEYHTWLSLHAFAVHGDDVYISLPGEAEATIVKAKLPSLTPVKTRLLDGFQVYFGCSPIYVVGSSLVVVTPRGLRLLTLQLDASPHRFEGLGEAMAWNAKRGILFASLTQGKGLPWVTLDVDEGCDVKIWAWDQPVALCTGREVAPEGGEQVMPAAPMRVFRPPTGWSSLRGTTLRSSCA
jgi:hypothetical protein